MTTLNIISKNKPVLQPLFHQLSKNKCVSMLKTLSELKKDLKIDTFIYYPIIL